jgi:hypothetical protein
VLRDGLIRSLSALPRFTGWKGGEMVFRHRVTVVVEPLAQGQPCKELIPCLRPRVV